MVLQLSAVRSGSTFVFRYGARRVEPSAPLDSLDGRFSFLARHEEGGVVVEVWVGDCRPAPFCALDLPCRAVGLQHYRQCLKATHHRRFAPYQLVGRFDQFQTWKSLEQSRECDFSFQAGKLVA